MQRILIAAVAACCFLMSIAVAQEFRATVTGRVLDSSDAAVPGVTVSARNTATNEVTTGTTGPQGVYRISFLRPGTYDISVEVAGFKKFVREGLILNVGQAATVDVRLEIGAVAEQVTVTGEAPLLDAVNAERGTLIDSRRVKELPLNTRNPLMLALLSAGVNFQGNRGDESPYGQGSTDKWTINGGQERSNDILLDGSPNTGRPGGSVWPGYVPMVDAVQEFKIQSNLYDSQYGHTGGGIINILIKSGTNAFHGTAYEFARRNAWDANSFQNNAQGAPKEAHYLDQFGFQVEGPIYFPKIYDGRNKSFVMFAYEPYHEGAPSPVSFSVPEPEMLNGDFSKLVDSQNRRITIYDPSTGRDVNGVWVRDAFPGNVIPEGRISPIAQKILGYLSKPNIKTPGVGYAVQNYFTPGGESVMKHRAYNFVVKADHNFNEKHRVFFRAASSDYSLIEPANGILGKVGEGAQDPERKINDAYVADWVGTLSATLIANVRLSYHRFAHPSISTYDTGFDLTSLGFPKSLVQQLSVPDWFGNYSFSGYQSLGGNWHRQTTNTVAAMPSVTKVHGVHVLKAGADMRWMQFTIFDAGRPLQLGADKGFTQKDYTRADALSGDSIATFLLGTPSSGNADWNARPFYFYRYYAPWVQDDWKVTRRLTLNLGFRWDLNFSPDEKYNRMNRGFDANAINPVDKLIDRNKFSGFPTLKGGLLFAGINGVPRISTNLDKDALQPRFGFAFQATSRFVLRGGWGRIYINPDHSSGDLYQTYGFSVSTPLVSSLDGGRTPIPNLLNNPFPSGVQQPPGSALGLLTYVGRGFNFVNQNFQIPHVNQFSFGVQYELPFETKVEASYVGSRTKNMQSSRSFNSYDLAFRQKCNLMEGGNPLYCDERLPNPFQGLDPFIGTASYTSPTLARSALAVPYPHFGGLTEVTRNDGAMWYNSLQVTVETRSRAGLNILANYTLAKQIEQGGFLDVQQNIVQRSLYASDRPHRFSVATIYQLPFGKGKRWLNTSHPVWSRLVSGWENTVMLFYQSGTPWSLPSNVLYIKDAKVDPDWSAPIVRGVKPCVATWNDNGTITMQAYSVQYGCTDYNFLIAPRFAPRFTPYRDNHIRTHSVPQADVSLNKTTRITEKTSVQFRAEAFNVTNTFYFGKQQFSNNANSSLFGTLTKSGISYVNTTPPRNIQLAVKFLW